MGTLDRRLARFQPNLGKGEGGLGEGEGEGGLGEGEGEKGQKERFSQPTYIGPSPHRSAHLATPGPPRIAEKTVQAPQGCSGGPTATIFRAIQHGLGPPEPVLRGHQLLIPISLCNHMTENRKTRLSDDGALRVGRALCRPVTTTTSLGGDLCATFSSRSWREVWFRLPPAYGVS